MQSASDNLNSDALTATEGQSLMKDKKNKQTSRKKKLLTTIQHHDDTTQRSNLLQKQILLTKYCKKKQVGNSKLIGQPQEYFLTNITQKQQLLEQQIKKKDQQISKLQSQKEKEQAKGNKLQRQFLDLTLKTKNALIKSKKEIAQIHRKNRSIINPQFGYFKDSGCNSFADGCYITQIKSKILMVEDKITVINEQKQKAQQQNKTMLLGKYQFYRKQIDELKIQLEIREQQVNRYKERLRLQIKQLGCIYFKQNWPLLKNRYQPLQLIGSGGFGQVYRGFDVQKCQDIAIKINIFDSRCSHEAFENLLKHLKRQIDIHKHLDHPNIAKMIDQLEVQNNRIGFVLEYCTGPQLKSYLKKQICLDERQSKNIIKQLVYAVKYLHDQKYKIVHYDLKPANILFHNGTIKIVDFGICKTIQTEQTKIDLTSPGVGTYWYLPPEVFDQKNPKVSSKVDIWSIGVIFYEMLYGKRPFGHGFSQSKIISQGVILNATKVEFPNQSPKKYRISEEAKNFICECLKYDQSERLSPLQAYQHDYLR